MGLSTAKVISFETEDSVMRMLRLCDPKIARVYTVLVTGERGDTGVYG